MTQTIIFATGNEGKLRELREMLSGIDATIVSMKEAGVYVDVEENGTTFEENALIKARAIAQKSGKLTLADDSGLEVDYLNKEPGIYSARYEGVDTPYEIKNQIIIDRVAEAKGDERSARFVCAIAAAFPDGHVETRRGTIEGQIAYEPAGENGFGYDPIFYVPEFGKTTAELSPDEKNKVSHRGRALEMIKEVL